MKKLEYRNLIITMIACSFLLSACSKPSETTKARKKVSSDQESSSTVEEEEDEKEEKGEEGEGEEKDPSDHTLDVSDPDSSSSDTSASSDTDGAKNTSNTPIVVSGSPIELGAANISNGGFATGDSLFSYYVTHPEKNQCAIVRENHATGQTDELYRTSPKTNPVLDCLNLEGDFLFFRENLTDPGQFALTKLDLTIGESERLTGGVIGKVLVYKHNLYFSKDGSLIRTDLNGENELEIFVPETSTIIPNVNFCIANDRVYFTDPAKFANGGIFFGSIAYTDINARMTTVLDDGSGVEASSEDLFYTDGDFLYFYGSPKDGEMGYYRCDMEGAGLELINKAAPYSRNFSDGASYIANDYELYLDKDGNGFNLFYTGNMDQGRICIVGNEIYFMETDATKYDSGTVAKRIHTDNAKEEILN